MQCTEAERTAIYEQYAMKVLRYFRAKTGNLQLSEDLCTDVFLKVYEKLPDFDESRASLNTWIYTIAHNRLIDYFRTRRVSEEIPETLAAESGVEDEILEREELTTLADALRSLPERERSLIVLRYHSGLTLKEIAERLNISYSYAKLLHNTALQKMRAFFEKS